MSLSDDLAEAQAATRKLAHRTTINVALLELLPIELLGMACDWLVASNLFIERMILDRSSCNGYP
ncbi:hypothetical protein A9975_34115 [Cupriavidus sp. UME77]|nr:hypothetical protein [Cupriavidus sp. UME77]